MRKKIVVLGSVNQDLVIQTPRLPRLGETVSGSGFATAQGGKGANQAVAAVRLGGEVALVAAVGNDEAGQRMKADFKAQGIDIRYCKTADDVATGTAVITVCGGDNCIILDPGANQKMTPSVADEAEALLKEAAFLVLQMEIPFKTVERAVQLAKQHNVRVLLNPAPALPLEKDFLRQVDILTPNETECEILTGIKVDNLDHAKKAVAFLNEIGVPLVALTLGEQGVVFNDGEKILHLKAKPVKAKDTTAAGDCFTGALAVALAENQSVQKAMSFAVAAASVAVTRAGAQPSLPSRAEADAALNNR